MASTAPVPAYKRIGVSPISGALGAEVTGADLANLDESTFAEIHRALLEHLVLFFRDQDLSVEAHKAFGRRFGNLYSHPYIKPMDGHPEVVEIIKEAEAVKNFGGSWHADLTYYDEPMFGAVLYALEVPPHGGDTLFGNLYLAYESLSQGMKDLLESLVAVHDDKATSLYSPDKIRSMGMREVPLDEEGRPKGTRAEHPVVRTHPESGRRLLFVNSVNTIGLKDMREEESQPLLDYLYKHSQKPEFTCRFRWTPGSVALWDNRCTQHLAMNDYHGHRRHMRRVLIAGDKPFLAPLSGT